MELFSLDKCIENLNLDGAVGVMYLDIGVFQTHLKPSLICSL